MARILVYIEHDESGLTDLSLQALTLAAELAGEGAEALLVGTDLEERAAELLGRGAAQVWTVEGPGFAPYLARPHVQALSAAVRERQPELVLLPSSTVGNDLGPCCAARLQAPCITGCERVVLGSGGPRLTRLEFDARVRAVYAPAASGPVFVTVQDGIVEPRPAGIASASESASVLALEAPDGGGEVVNREVAAKTVNLKDARVIIGGGAGVGTRENFALLEQLARRLGGEIGATRASVDAGWVSAERQIGQTGVVVRPELYIACGISGAVQHLVGIRETKTVVAINNDSSAPIFKVSHWRIVGDLNTVVPKLLELLG
jgi:electron transfer flavoprotein alpha subunit